MNRYSILIAVIVIIIGLAGSAFAQQAPLSPEQKQLIKVQIEKEKALVKYYDGQLDLARKQYEAEQARQPKTLWEKYERKDPADLIETLGILVGIVMILVTVVSARRSAERDRLDLRFYEALHRFGDQSSPALRSSAAGTIAQMGRRKDYADTALDQLLSGLMLEEHPAVQVAIKNAIIGLAGSNPGAVKSRLKHADPALQEKTRTLLWND